MSLKNPEASSLGKSRAVDAAERIAHLAEDLGVSREEEALLVALHANLALKNVHHRLDKLSDRLTPKKS